MCDVLRLAHDNQAAILAGVVVFLGSWFFMKSWFSRNRKSTPGLPSIPILGSLPWLSIDVNHLTFMKLYKKYGAIYTMDLGSQRTVVLNDHRSIHDALVKQAVIFADRPPFNMLKTNKNQHGIVVARFDEKFSRTKQVSLAVMRDLGCGRNAMEERILCEVRDLLDTISNQEAKPFDPGELLYVSVSNIACSLLFNKRFAHHDARLIEKLTMLREMIKTSGELVIAKTIPLMSYLPWAKRRLQVLIRCDRIIKDFIREELNSQSVSRNPEDHESNFMAAYTHKMAAALDAESLPYIAFDFFAAGSDTTSTTLRWALLYMANNPDVQSRVQLEIDDVIGQGRPPSMSDRGSLNYVEAVLLETLRKSTITPLAVPHRLSSDTELQGFFLEKGTVVYTNLWAVHHDPDVWLDPEKFDAERFLDCHGQVTGREKIISFGVGRRACLGEALARQELFLYFTSILQRFHVLHPPGKEKMSEEAIFGTVLTPKPHQLVLKQR